MANKKQETPEQKQYREAVESIAKNIGALARAVQSLVRGPLKRKALLVLLSSASGEPQKTVDAVLKALEDLEKDWINN